jgi:hypothetical protein
MKIDFDVSELIFEKERSSPYLKLRKGQEEIILVPAFNHYDLIFGFKRSDNKEQVWSENDLYSPTIAQMLSKFFWKYSPAEWNHLKLVEKPLKEFEDEQFVKDLLKLSRFPGIRKGKKQVR